MSNSTLKLDDICEVNSFSPKVTYFVCWRNKNASKSVILENGYIDCVWERNSGTWCYIKGNKFCDFVFSYFFMAFFAIIGKNRYLCREVSLETCR